MKRLLLIVILLFPAITLLLWVCRGMSMRHQEPASLVQPANAPINTNLNELPPAK